MKNKQSILDCSHNGDIIIHMAFIWRYFTTNKQILDESSMSIDEYPDKIKVTGLPFMLQGWNTTFDKKKNDDGEVVYCLNSYILYFFIPIIGVTISKHDDEWRFTRNCDEGPFIRNNKLFGKWHDGYGMTINPA